MRKSFGHLDHLLLGDPKVLHERIRIDLDAEVGKSFLRPRPHLSISEEAPGTHEFVAQEKIFHRGKVGAQIELLKNDTDAEAKGLSSMIELHLVSLEINLSRIRLVNAGKDFHQGGFAGAVFT